MTKKESTDGDIPAIADRYQLCRRRVLFVRCRRWVVSSTCTAGVWGKGDVWCDFDCGSVNAPSSIETHDQLVSPDRGQRLPGKDVGLGLVLPPNA